MSSSPKKPKPPKPFLTKAEQEELARKARARRRQRKLQEAQRREQDRLEEEERVRKEHETAQWNKCLDVLQATAPQLKTNPWLIVHNPALVHEYLDALTEVLAGFRAHADDFDRVRNVLSQVYETFVDLARFAKVQPAFYVVNPKTVQRCVRLLEQVAHKGSDKSLFPNVLHFLTPTLERPHLHDLLADANLVPALLGWVPEWIPAADTLLLLLQVYRSLSATARMRTAFLQHPHFDRLLLMAHGLEPGFTQQQQAIAQAALYAYKDAVPLVTAAGEAGASSSSTSGAGAGSAASSSPAAAAAGAAAGASPSGSAGAVGRPRARGADAAVGEEGGDGAEQGPEGAEEPLVADGGEDLRNSGLAARPVLSDVS